MKATRRNETGQVGGAEAVLLGVLVFVAGTLMVTNAWGVIDAKLAVDNAAREAVRAFVLAPSQDEASSDADNAASEAIAASGRDPSRMTLSLSGTLTRCSEVSATVSYRVSLITIPLVGDLGSGLTVSSKEGALVDPFRTGVSGGVTCG